MTDSVWLQQKFCGLLLEIMPSPPKAGLESSVQFSIKCNEIEQFIMAAGPACPVNGAARNRAPLAAAKTVKSFSEQYFELSAAR